MSNLKTITGTPNTVVDQSHEARDFAIMLLAEHGYTSESYNPHRVGAWRIWNEFGPIAVAIGSCEQDALDDAADRGLLDSERMTDEDYQEYSENGWDDSYIHLGNASEPFWCEHLHIERIV